MERENLTDLQSSKELIVMKRILFVMVGCHDMDTSGKLC